MACERLHQRSPLCEVARHGDVAAPEKHGRSSACQLARQERKLHKRFYADAEHGVKQQVYVLPVVVRYAGFVFLVNAHVVVQQAVEPQITEPAFVVHHGKVPLVFGEQRFVRPASADTKIVAAAVFAVRPAKIRFNFSHFFLPIFRRTPQTNRRLQKFLYPLIIHKSVRFFLPIFAHQYATFAASPFFCRNGGKRSAAVPGNLFR